MSGDVLAAFVVGVIIPLLAALLGKEPVGRWLLAGSQREESALATLMEITRESIDGWRALETAYVKLAEVVRGGNTEGKYYYQDLRDKAVRREERMVRVEELLQSLVTILGSRRGDD